MCLPILLQQLILCIKPSVSIINTSYETLKGKQHSWILDKCTPYKVYCKAFEDNPGALHMETAQIVFPNTKHINYQYHHLSEHIKNKAILIHAISAKEKLANTFTKTLNHKNCL